MEKYDPDIVIDVQGLYKVFGPHPEHALEEFKKGKSKKDLSLTNHILALCGIDLKINRGKIFVVMGLSGSGKSTFLRCLNRLVEPTAGSIIIDGTDVTNLPKKHLLHLRSQKLGMVFQHFGLLPHRNVIENVVFGLEVKKEKRALRYQKAHEALNLVGLGEWETRMPAELSGGMQQRVGFARALALNPPILLMDEPFSGLDPLIRKEMQRELLSLQQRLQKTIVFITHDLDEALTLGDRIMILKDGRIEQEGIAKEIVFSPASEYIDAFIHDVDLLKVLPAEDFMETELSVFQIEGKLIGPHALEVQENSPVFVIDEKERYIGSLSSEKFRDVLTRGHLALREHSVQGTVSLDPRDPVRNALAYLTRPPFAVAITNGDHHLIGAITWKSFFSGLGQRESNYSYSGRERWAKSR